MERMKGRNVVMRTILSQHAIKTRIPQATLNLLYYSMTKTTFLCNMHWYRKKQPNKLFRSKNLTRIFIFKKFLRRVSYSFSSILVSNRRHN